MVDGGRRSPPRPPRRRKRRRAQGLVPKGWLIGAAINQNQSDGRDTVAVDLVTRQFNTISPENLLKFQSLHPEPVGFTFDAQDRYVAFGRDRGMAVIGHTLVWHSQTPRWVWDGSGRRRSPIAPRCSRACATHIAHGRRPLQGQDSRLGRRQRGAERGRHAARLAVAPRHRRRLHRARRSSSRTRPIPAPSSTTTTTTSRPGPPSAPAPSASSRTCSSAASASMPSANRGIGGSTRRRPTEIDQTITELRATGVKVMITELDVNLLPPAGTAGAGQPPSPATESVRERPAR